MKKMRIIGQKKIEKVLGKLLLNYSEVSLKLFKSFSKDTVLRSLSKIIQKILQNNSEVSLKLLKSLPKISLSKTFNTFLKLLRNFTKFM